MTAPYGGHVDYYKDQNLDVDVVKEFLNDWSETPKFVFDSSLLGLAREEEYHQSLIDMKEAGVLKLPYPAMLVEFDDNGVRYFAFLFSPEDIYNDGVEPDDVQGVMMYIHKDEHGEYLVVPYCINTSAVGTREKKDSYRLGALRPRWLKKAATLDEMIGETYMKDGRNLTTAWILTMLVMSTQGVQKEIITVDKLNKARSKSGKRHPIPQHTYIRIGHVYQKDGSSVTYDERKSPRPHWRRGHLRRQRCGKGRAEIKLTYINPMLIAYHEGESVFAPDYTVKK